MLPLVTTENLFSLTIKDSISLLLPFSNQRPSGFPTHQTLFPSVPHINNTVERLEGLYTPRPHSLNTQGVLDYSERYVTGDYVE